MLLTAASAWKSAEERGSYLSGVRADVQRAHGLAGAEIGGGVGNDGRGATGEGAIAVCRAGGSLQHRVVLRAIEVQGTGADFSQRARPTDRAREGAAKAFGIDGVRVGRYDRAIGGDSGIGLQSGVALVKPATFVAVVKVPRVSVTVGAIVAGPWIGDVDADDAGSIDDGRGGLGAARAGGRDRC